MNPQRGRMEVPLRGLVASGDGKQIAPIYNLPKRFDDASISVLL